MPATMALDKIRNAPAWYDVIIVGAGLAGLVNAIELSRAGHRVLVIEKKEFPFHRVCGEYVSHEVLGYLQSLGFDPYDYGAARITRLRISSPSGRNIYSPLQLGGFGLSRYIMDDALRQLAVQYGAQVRTGLRVTDITCENDRCGVHTADGTLYEALLCIGSWGKRDMLDKKLERPFMKAHTGYVGVKYHIRTDYPADEIGLDNFAGGYCGISRIEDGKYNLCYLYNRSYAGTHKNIPELEEIILHQNPVLQRIFRESDFLLEQPEVINEISFAPKSQVTQNILLCGDTAGLITPLCGNGMSMAISAARMLSRLIIRSGVLKSAHTTTAARLVLEQQYTREWQKAFGKRLYWGRTIQRFFGSPRITELTMRCIHSLPAMERWLISQTHGQPLVPERASV